MYITPSDIVKDNRISIIYINVQSMNNKFQYLRDIVHQIESTFLCLQETWGRNATKDYSIRHYQKPSIKTRQGVGMNLGGGVGIWVCNGIDFDLIKSPFKSEVIETITILVPTKRLVIINVYRPFGDMDIFFDDIYLHIKNLKVKYPGFHVIAVGDFNINLINPDEDGNRLLELFTNEGFHQSVTEPTRLAESSKTLIDHVYSNSRLPLHTDIVTAGISDHEITFTKLEQRSKLKKEFVTKRWVKALT